MLIIVLLLCGIVIASVVTGGFGVLSNKDKVAEISSPKVKLSWPSKEILKEYKALPVENRPFADITSMLIALDIKYGGAEKINPHYEYYYDKGWTACPNCRAPGIYGKCLHDGAAEYKKLHDQIAEIQQAVDDQKHALEVAKVQPDLDDIKILTERLRQEQEIITSVTKKLT